MPIPGARDEEKLIAAADDLLALSEEIRSVADGHVSQTKLAAKRGLSPSQFSGYLKNRFSHYIKTRLVGIETLPALVNAMMTPEEKLMADILGIEIRSDVLVRLPEFDGEALWDVAETLTPREFKSLEMTYGRGEYAPGLSMAEIARSFNVTQERVRQIRAKALRRLRHPSRLRKAFPMLTETGCAQINVMDEVMTDAKLKLEDALKKYAVAHEMSDITLRLQRDGIDEDPDWLADEALRLLTGGEPRNVREMPVEDMDLSVRAYNCLKRAGLNTLGDIVDAGAEGIMQVRNLGRKNYDEIDAKVLQATGSRLA